MEQSKRLLELCLKPETADMLHYKSASMKIWGVLATPYSKEVNGLEKYYFPSWSLHRLITMLPYKVNKSSNDASLLQITRIKDNCYIVGYYGYKVVEMPLFDALIRLIEELIKDNLFNKDYLK